ncbi:DUF6538 domain-containing protein [Variovorax ureilyticus]|uniref:DUF6538 domain-containing protein n=1 Tax=Variovorax ureilyticus TaxID=1836198 RepID=UPI003D669474
MFDPATESTPASNEPAGDATETSHQYLFRRGDVYYFKRRFPSDVLHSLGRGQKKAHWQSLKTASLQEALRKLPVEVEKFDAAVAKARARKSQVKVPTAPRSEGTTKYLLLEHIPFIVGRFEYLHLETDIEERRAMEDDGELDARLADFEHGLKMKRRAAAREDFSHVEEVAQTLLAEECLIAPPGSVAHTSLLRELMRADIETLQKQCDAIEGELFVLPPNAPVAPRLLPTMQTAFAEWQRSQSDDRTIDAYGRFVNQFESRNRGLPMASIDLERANGFRDHLHECGLDRRSIMNSVGGLATIWDFYETKFNRVTSNPFRRVRYDGLSRRAPSEDRRRFEVSELATLFNSPIYTGEQQLQGQVKESGYWAPLLATFAGGRIEEIAQLRVADILQINGTWTIRIENLEHDQGTKTMSSHRLVPIHQELIKCGFLSYVAKQKLAGRTHVFPSQGNKNTYGLWSNALGKWFGRYLDKIGLDDSRLVFHSLRYSFKQRCAECGITEEPRDALTGHWLSKDSSREYMKAKGRQYPFPLLARAIEQLRYDELDLRHLYVADPYDQVDRAWRF